jgi:phosphoglycolate phosphatase-like HAD superfamily hydrolase
VAELLVLWDVDYTLLNAAGLGNRLYEAVFEDMFGRELTVIAPKAGRTDRAILMETLTLARVAEPGAHVDEFMAELGRRAAAIDPRTLGGVRALPGAAAAIEALAAAGLRQPVERPVRGEPVLHQSVLTGNIRPLAALKLTAAGLGEHLDLDTGAYGDAHEVRAELVTLARRAAAAAYGADFGGPSTVLVGDTPLDVAAALAAGARAVAVATGTYSEADLVAAGAQVVLADLTDTARVVAAITCLRAAEPPVVLGAGAVGEGVVQVMQLRQAAEGQGVEQVGPAGRAVRHALAHEQFDDFEIAVAVIRPAGRRRDFRSRAALAVRIHRLHVFGRGHASPEEVVERGGIVVGHGAHDRPDNVGAEVRLAGQALGHAPNRTVTAHGMARRKMSRGRTSRSS